MEGLAWLDVIKIAAGSGVVAAVFNVIFSAVKESLQRKEQRRLDAEFDAIHLISKLDALAVECANNFWIFHQAWGQARGTIHEKDVPGCSKPDVTIDAGSLAKIDRSIACRIAWLENDVSLGDNGIRARWEAYMDGYEASECYADLVGYYGYEALLISKALREKYSLTHAGAGWGMPKIEEQLKTCSENTKKLFKDDD